MYSEALRKVIYSWKGYFFMEPVLILALALCFLIGLIHNNRAKERILFTIYSFVGLLLFFLTDLANAFNIFSVKQSVIFQESANTIFEGAELTAFYYFFKKCLRTSRLKILFTIMSALFLTLTIIFFAELLFQHFDKDKIEKQSFYINVVEFLILSAMCLGYFYELFAIVVKTELVMRPSFFIVTTAFFYSILMIPFFTLANELRRLGTTIFSIFGGFHYILLTIVSLSIARGFRSKLSITI